VVSAARKRRKVFTYDVNFLNVQHSTRQMCHSESRQKSAKLPQRITPGNFIFRTTANSQMRCQFLRRGRAPTMTVSSTGEAAAGIGNPRSSRVRPASVSTSTLKEELAHYAPSAFECAVSIVWDAPAFRRSKAVTHRGDFDAEAPQYFSRQEAGYFRPQPTNRAVCPYVVETLGCAARRRCCLCRFSSRLTGEESV